MKITPISCKHRRLPGEIAFDRCFLPLVAVIVLQIIYRAFIWEPIIGSSQGPAEEEGAAAISPPLWHAWFWFTIGLLLAVLWFRAITPWPAPGAIHHRKSFAFPPASFLSRLALSPADFSSIRFVDFPSRHANAMLLADEAALWQYSLDLPT